MQRKAQYDKLLQEVAICANSDASVTELLKFVLDRVCEYSAMPLGHAFVPAVDNPSEFVSANIWHLDDPARFDAFSEVRGALRFTSGASLIGEVIKTRQVTWLSDLEDGDANQELLDAMNIRAGFAFPALADLELAAVLEFYSYEVLPADDPFHEVIPQIRLQINRVFERDRHVRALRQSEEQERQQHAQAEALRDTAAILLGSALDLDLVLDKILEQIGLVIPNDGACVMLAGDEFDGQYYLAHAKSRNIADTVQDPQRFTFRIEDRADLRAMYETQKPLVLDDVQTLGIDPESLVFSWTHSLLGVPLRYEGHITGFLIAESAATASFTQEQAAILQAFADLASTAIQNANLYATLEERVIERTAQLNDEKERVEAILNNSSDAIIFGSYDGVIRQVNPAFHELFAYGEHEIAGDSLLSLADPEDYEALIGGLHLLVNHHQSSRVEIVALRKDQTRFDADVALAAIYQQERIQGVVCGIRDITERKQAEREVLAALEKERELSELKSRFASMVSHEFRTPLTIISSSADILRQYADRLEANKRLAYLEQIQVQIKHLVDLLNDVLTLSRADSVDLRLSAARIDLTTLCQELVAEMQMTTQDHRLELAISGRSQPLWLDETLMRQAIGNLLSNAVKYSPSGGLINIDLVYDEDEVQISVQDRGIGIPEEDVKHLFEPYHRAVNVGNISGTGLGLPIVKRAVDAHRGTIGVRTGVGEGTTFTIRIPLNIEFGEGR